MTTKWTQDQTNSKNPEVTNQNTLYNKQEINSALEVILKVMKLDAAHPFNTPVDPVTLRIPDYSEVIDHPMDFGTICKNLKNGVKYTNTMDILNDVQYVWDNCSKYYTKGHYLLELMKRLKKKFTKYWTEAGLSMEQPQKMDEHASLQPMKETLRGNTNGQCGSVDPDQRQDQICNTQPQPYQHPRNYNMFYPPMQRPQCNMSSYNHPAPNPHGDKHGRFSGKGYSHSPFGPGSQGGQFLWRNNPIGSQLHQDRPSFGNVRSYNSHHGWQPRPESAGRRYPFEQGYTDGPMFDHPTHMYQNRPSVHLPHLPTPSSPKAASQRQHKSFQSQPLLISDDETDLSVSEEDISSQSPVGYVMRSRDSGPSSSNFQSPQPLEGATRVHLSLSHPPLSYLQVCSNKEVLEPSQIAPPQPLTSCGQPHQPHPPPGFGKKEPSQIAPPQPLTSCGQPHQPHPPPGFGKKDGGGKFFPEPGRCRRNDGKKWQCSRDAVAINQKYCERHIGRGRFRSRHDHSAISTNLAPVAESRNEYSLSTPVEPASHQAGIDEGCLDNPEDQLRSSQILHPETSSYHGVPLHHPKEISVLGSKAYSGLDKREVPRKHSRPQLKFSMVQLGSNADARFEEREAPQKRLKESNLCVQMPRQQEAVQTFSAEGNVITQIKGQDRNKFVQALDGPSRTEPESVEIDLNANNVEIKEMKGKMASMEQTCAQVASQITNIMSTISDMQKKLSEKNGGPPVLSQAAKVSNDSGRPSASGVIIRDIFSRVYHKK